MSFLPIAHYDIDAFFASVEEKLNPRLVGKPVIVCGVDPQGKNINRGVVSTASYAARRFGITSGMPVFKAKLLCRDGFFVKGHFGEYQKYGDLVFEIMERFTPNIQRTNLDEGFLDFTGCQILYPDTFTLCDNIRTRIKKEVGLPVSIGLANSRVLAKLACDLTKPDGLLVVKNAKNIAHLSIKQLPGVGPKTQKLLETINIKTIGDLVTHKEKVISLLGKFGVNLYFSAIGVDNIWYEKRDSVKSVGRSTTFFQNSKDPGFILPILFELCEQVFYQLARDKLTFNCLSVTIRAANFEDKQKSKTLTSKVEKLVDFYDIACSLLYEIWDKKTMLRLVGVKVSKLLPFSPTLFLKEESKNTNVVNTVVSLREKYGKDILKSGLTPIQSELTQKN